VPLYFLDQTYVWNTKQDLIELKSHTLFHLVGRTFSGILLAVWWCSSHCGKVLKNFRDVLCAESTQRIRSIYTTLCFGAIGANFLSPSHHFSLCNFSTSRHFLHNIWEGFYYLGRCWNRGHILEVVRKIKKTPTPAPTPTPKRQKTGEVKTPPYPHQKPKILQNWKNFN